MMKKLLVSLLSALLCISVVAEPEIQSDGNQNMNNITIDENGDVFVSPLKYHFSSDTTAEVIFDRSYKDLKSVVIPSKIRISGHVYLVTSIGNEAFYGCSVLTSIKIPKRVTTIESRAFSLCEGLTRIEIPSSVTSIGKSAFRGCGGLTNIEIPSSVTSIGDGAFHGCRGLTSIKIPLSVTSIGEYAFYNCRNLEIFINNSKENLMVGDAAFYGCKSVKFLK